VSPRKSSTSSGKHSLRPRYLGVEVVGEPFAPRPWFEAALARSLGEAEAGVAPPRVRVIRSEHSWALVEIEHSLLAKARRSWNGTIEGPAGRRATVATHRTWGTLKDAKAWLRQRSLDQPVIGRGPPSGAGTSG
jgi:RNase P/RNase MRP subunit POP5